MQLKHGDEVRDERTIDAFLLDDFFRWHFAEVVRWHFSQRLGGIFSEKFHFVVVLANNRGSSCFFPILVRFSDTRIGRFVPRLRGPTPFLSFLPNKVSRFFPKNVIIHIISNTNPIEAGFTRAGVFVLPRGREIRFFPNSVEFLAGRPFAYNPQHGNYPGARKHDTFARRFPIEPSCLRPPLLWCHPRQPLIMMSFQQAPPRASIRTISCCARRSCYATYGLPFTRKSMRSSFERSRDF